MVELPFIGYYYALGIGINTLFIFSMFTTVFQMLFLPVL